ncbi:hypothetical protein AVEN_39218-1 [Araneus ventricosus]|uniref:Uncharacterized protein n=1 Tax=Araneus ventricosus TaxID=182803 RepID=A0A4Y2IBJ5_ARAVE|nr:hypothetical protein AVEN_39218-1 [Araneus ventricosus]
MWSSYLNCRSVSNFGFNRLKKGVQIAYWVSLRFSDAKKGATAGAFSPPVFGNGGCYYCLAYFFPTHVRADTRKFWGDHFRCLYYTTCIPCLEPFGRKHHCQFHRRPRPL